MNYTSEIISDIDADFHHTAISARNAVWAIEGLTDREKVLLSIGNDICSGAMDVSLEMHARLAFEFGVSFESVREVARHLAPYCGYPRALTALREMATFEGRFTQCNDAPESIESEPAPEALEALKMLASIAGPLNTHVQRNWRRPYLSINERDLIAVLRRALLDARALVQHPSRYCAGKQHDS